METSLDSVLLFLAMSFYLVFTMERAFNRYCETRLLCTIVDGGAQIAAKIAPDLARPAAANPQGNGGGNRQE